MSKSDANAQKRSDNPDASLDDCPTCGAEIQRTETRGPTHHEAVPCGCSLGAVTERTSGCDDRLRTDGGQQGGEH